MTTAASTLTKWSSGGAAEFSRKLETLLASKSALRHPRLSAAMHHAVMAGGKRLRPYLVFESAGLFGIDQKTAFCVAAALEFVHCYSLVHDDLPAMDDDDLRRGQPTVHKAFDEATAILAGDGLLTLAFSMLTAPVAGLSAVARLRLIGALASAAGADGMVGGQMLDLAAEGRFEPVAAQRLSNGADAEQIMELQGLKTGALISFAAQAGAMMCPRPARRDLDALGGFGRALGLAFQIRDDLIDVEVDPATAGKATGKDQASGKATFVGLLGVEGARRRLLDVTAEGKSSLSCFGGRAHALAEILEFNIVRRS